MHSFYSEYVLWCILSHVQAVAALRITPLTERKPRRQSSSSRGRTFNPNTFTAKEDKTLLVENIKMTQQSNQLSWESMQSCHISHHTHVTNHRHDPFVPLSTLPLYADQKPVLLPPPAPHAACPPLPTLSRVQYTNSIAMVLLTTVRTYITEVTTIGKARHRALFSLQSTNPHTAVTSLRLGQHLACKPYNNRQ